MKFLLLLVIFLLSGFLYSQEEVDSKVVFNETVYDPFFSMVIKDNEGEKFNISKVAFFDEFNDKKFFFWVRRNSGQYALSFKNIKKITFDENDFADKKYKNFTRCTLELITGVSHVLFLKTTGHLDGFDADFASPVTFYLHYNLIESIEFKQFGTYKLCPFCGTIYFDKDVDVCPYDKTPLVEGVISETDK